MINKKLKGFSLIELIVVITILSILTTLAFIGFKSYAGNSRDSKRISDVKQIAKGLEMIKNQNSVLPTPTDSITIGSGSLNLLVQGRAGKEVLNTIRVNEDAVDPLEKTHYTYTTNAQGTKYQLLALLENNPTANLLLPTTYANYETRIPYVTGYMIGTILEQLTNIPVSELESNIDLSIDVTPYKIVYSRGQEEILDGINLYNNILTNSN